MDALLAAYGSDDEGAGAGAGGDGQNTAPTATMAALKSRILVNTAPAVRLEEKVHSRVIDPTKTEVTYNAPVEEMWSATAGPTAPWLGKSVVPGQRNTLNGFVEDAYVDAHSFESMHRMFVADGVTLDPTTGATLHRTVRKRKAPQVEMPAPASETKKKEVQLDAEGNPIVEEEEEGEEGAGDLPKKRAKVVWSPKAIFHAGERVDYMGRTWIAPPTHLKPSTDHECFLPKKVIHTWSGHSKGVTQIRFFPKFGHLLLSASLDNTMKIWEVYGKRRCMQTYKVHEMAVRDIDFSADGSRIISCSYDKFARVTDTETGQVICSFKPSEANAAYPHKGPGGLYPSVVRFNPLNHNEFLAGLSDKRILQYDVRSNTVTQEYDRHLDTISSITFIKPDRFVSTSDDKKIYVWDYGIGVETSYIAEPDMHAIGAATLSPDGKWFLAQAADNSLDVYTAADKFRKNNKKSFKGHNSTGYGCKPDMSPDGKYVVSGSSGGELVFWDWKTKRIFSRLRSHKRVAIGVQWHPIEQSKVASCSWDNTIKLWD
eukprot:TRINITY_DN74_c0_g1_i2.p1 TRINITY_DN74_c0_g1~~TRINITY_DN74_c0_g1_i2.p1  ORF type:complete len:542 (+),score=120.92 TRINITY_DN74_c0_g1_i2:663-2288(+)